MIFYVLFLNQNKLVKLSYQVGTYVVNVINSIDEAEIILISI